MRGQENQGVANAAVGAEEDVRSVALDITPAEINAIATSDEPVDTRSERLLAVIAEIEARMDASTRGRDLAPLLAEAKDALRTIERQKGEDR